ncbi:MAG: Uma2 family endonuclease [Planctomycetes bacterium]|nr:Uma2 family endonuclease [Planctomycetota bacterium]
MGEPRADRLTAADYLTRERVAERKSEYFAGEVFATSGASRAHSLISVNLLVAFGTQLADGPCETYGADLRVKSVATGLYTYPDGSVVCGEPVFEDDHLDTLTNPTVIVEVLAPSTEAYDRGRKFEHYARIPSLAHDVLVDQFRPHVDVLTRDGGRWTITAADGVDAALELPAIDLVVPLAELYRRVELRDEAARPPDRDA